MRTRIEKTNFWIYVSGQYEEAYIRTMQQQILSQFNIQLKTTTYKGGEDFAEGIKKLRNDCSNEKRKEILHYCQRIFVQGDYDLEEVVKKMENINNKLKKFH